MDEMIGKKFGYWTVLGKGEKTKHGQSTYKCKCDCGTERDVSTYEIKKGKTKSCGCYKKEVAKKLYGAKDITGKKFFYWTVLGREGNINKKAAWKCRCKCGAERVIKGIALRSGGSKSCGCYRKSATTKTLIDMTGKKINRWYVLSRNTEDSRRGAYWNCQCECGNKKVVKGGSLRSGESKSCGCINDPEDFTGKVFTRYTVLGRSKKKNRSGDIFWRCRCECGAERVVIGTSLRTGKTKSCGCYAADNSSERNLKDITGKRYGMLTAIKRKYVDKNLGAYWLCDCDCGKTHIAQLGSLGQGGVKSCGCLARKAGGLSRTKEYDNAAAQRRNAIKLQAMPKWSDKDKINRIYYLKPKVYGVKFHVDHIVPLQSDIVCGLHVENNLQYLIDRANLSKGNRFNPETHIHEMPL